MALSHIVMHLALCSAAARLKTHGALPVHIVVLDKIDRRVVEETERVSTSGAADATAEFDINWGLYLAQAQMRSGSTMCSKSLFFSVLPDHDRQLTMNLQNGLVGTPVPVIIHGKLPAEFSYADPEVVLFGKDTKCDGPVGTPIAATIDQQNDDRAFYASVYPSVAIMQNAPVLPAIKLKDSSGGYHYVKMPANFISFGRRWPGLDQLDVKDDLIDFIAGKPEDTLLCMPGEETTTEMH